MKKKTKQKTSTTMEPRPLGRCGKLDTQHRLAATGPMWYLLHSVHERGKSVVEPRLLPKVSLLV